MDFNSVQYGVDRIVQRVRAGKLALPDFQREFVWSPAQVVELLDSVARQWPIGALLLLSGPQPFATRKIEAGPELGDEGLDLYILDGQQRVTSLFHAIQDVSEYCYYIDFAALVQDGDEYIRWERRAKFERDYPTVERRAGARRALIREIWDGEAFYGWLEHVPPDDRADFMYLRERRLAGLQSKVYKMMAIQLDQEIDLEALSRIFETLNRAGMRLNAFDLMVAALYPAGFRLRDEWQAALEAHEVMRAVEPDALEILKLIALLVRADLGTRASKGVRQGDLLRLDRALISRYWPVAIDLYASALEFCRQRFGCVNSDLVPSWSMILGVCAWLRAHPDQLHLTEKWWADKIFAQTFSQAANTRVVAEFDAITSAPNPLQLVAREIDISSLYEPARKNGLLARGFAAHLVRAGGIDPLDGQPLQNGDGFAFRALGVDGKMRRLSSDDRVIDIIVVTKKSDKSMGRTKDLRGSDHFMRSLASQGIDEVGERDLDFLSPLIEVGDGA